jgi:DNA-binding helix-hairpin-helix protein with protein kinase domain
LTQYQKRVRETLPALELARQRFEKARTDELADLRHLNHRRQEVQLRQFLSQRMLRDSDIPGVGDARKATLAAYNVLSAADIHGILQVPGIGSVLMGKLLAWRRQCEAQFRYNAGAPLPVAEVNAVKLKHAQLRQSALAELRGGAGTLGRLESSTQVALKQAKLDVQIRASALAQAKADLTTCS